MSVRVVVLRRRAIRDIEQTIGWYRREAGETVALSFVDALERTLDRIGRQSAAGSLRYALELDLPGLRASLITGVPYLAFHVSGPAHVEVWRVLHGERDLPATLVDDDFTS